MTNTTLKASHKVTTPVPALLSHFGGSGDWTFQTHPPLLEWRLEPGCVEEMPDPSLVLPLPHSAHLGSRVSDGHPASGYSKPSRQQCHEHPRGGEGAEPGSWGGEHPSWCPYCQRPANGKGAEGGQLPQRGDKGSVDFAPER